MEDDYSHKYSSNQIKKAKSILQNVNQFLEPYIKSLENLNEMYSDLRDIFDYMESHSDTITLSDLAAHFGYHPVYLSRLLPKLFGKNFSSLLLDIRMKKAKILLDHTDLTIEKIAAVLGYSNSSNFYKSFRHYYGKSPRSLS